MPKNDSQDAPEEPELVLCIPSHREEAERLLALSKAEPDSRAIHRDQTQDADHGADAWTPAELRLLQQQPDRQQANGDVHPSRPVEAPASDPVSRAKALSASVMNRLKAQGKWFGLVDLVRDQMMKEAKAAYPDLVQRQLWVYSELDRMYPPLTVQTSEIPIHIGNSDVSPLIPTKAISETASDTGQIQGLSELPKGWPELPANASLAVEIGWVQANRLLVVTERPGKATRVDLSKARGPAPSYAALGWLETSIRSYAKFVDVAAKVSGGDDEGESAVMRRERKSIEEVEALLREMELEPLVCPKCGETID